MSSQPLSAATDSHNNWLNSRGSPRRGHTLPIGANGQSNIVGTEVPIVLQILLDADFSLAFEDPDNELDPEDTEAMMAFDGVITALIDNITIQ